MGIVSIRTDIHPRCDRHAFSIMQPVVIQRQIGDEEPSWFPAFACTEELCHRRYNSAYGYFTLSHGGMDPDTKLIIPCPEDGLPMYIDKFESGIGLKIWRCAHFGCTGHHAVRGATTG